jgi:methyltransferase
MAAPLVPLALYLGVVLLERVVELMLSRRNARRLAERGGVEFGREHFLLFVVLHSLYPIALAWEVLGGGARPPVAWPWFLAVWLVAQALRVGAIATLGPFWNVRVWVVPGVTPVSHGLYRWLRHPNYVAVILEFLAAPMMFGAWRTALVFSVLNAVALAVRIPVEERALAWAAEEGEASSKFYC